MAIILCLGENSMQNLFIDHYPLKNGGELGTRFGRKTAEERRLFSVAFHRNGLKTRYELRNESFCFVCVLLGISPASDCDLPPFRNPLSVPS
jgi:hypothetical protein